MRNSVDVINTRLDRGRRVLRVGPVLLESRSILVALVAWVCVAALAIFAIVSGSAGISFAEAISALTGNADKFVSMVVLEWRLPRILIAVFVGAALAMSGAIFQQLTRNPLGSPDIIGFQTGAYSGALVVMLVLRGSPTAVMFGALIGGVATTLVVFALAASNTVRLVIVGIAVSAVLASINTWMLLSAEIEDASMARQWGAGSLSGVDWPKLTMAAVSTVVFAIFAIGLVRPLRITMIGIPFATALGQRVRLVQITAIVVGIGLIAVATATVGPISFIALAAPQIARRLSKSDGLSLGSTAAVGALLLLLADVVAQRIYPPSPLPVGIVTTSIGGVYFLWLLMRERKKK